jgi:hypothetical protein
MPSLPTTLDPPAFTAKTSAPFSGAAGTMVMRRPDGVSSNLKATSTPATATGSLTSKGAPLKVIVPPKPLTTAPFGPKAAVALAAEAPSTMTSSSREKSVIVSRSTCATVPRMLSAPSPVVMVFVPVPRRITFGRSLPTIV